MVKMFYKLAFLFVGFTCLGQGKTDEIVEEGKRLYKSEMASWYGTDVFIEKYPNREKIGGYLSYSESELVTKCIFFSNAEKPVVIGTMTFDPSFSVETVKTDLNERDFSENEKDLYSIRKTALAAVNSDTLFKRYEKINFNFIPLISNGERKVYILSGPKTNGVMIFGNDYLLTFDKKNVLKSKKALHRNILPMEYEGSVSGMHSHTEETGEYITPTDICTLMLYEKFAKWESHYVMSKKYVSIWNCKNDTLFVMTRKAFEKIAKD